MNVTNGECKNKCENFPNCKPCGEIEASKIRQRAIADRISSRIKSKKV